jgi:hypothetical protein
LTIDATLQRPAAHRRAGTMIFAREPDWYFSIMLVLEVIFLFGALPALSAGAVDRELVTMLQFVLVATAIGLVVRSNTLRLALAASFGIIFVARLLPGGLPRITVLAMVFSYNVLLTFVVARAVFRPGEVNHHRIAGAVFVYLNIALVFALAFAAQVTEMPDAIAGLQAGKSNHAYEMIHFSLSTLTSIGDGNVLPLAPVARSLADLETVIGQLFPAILLSRLVGLHLSRPS